MKMLFIIIFTISMALVFAEDALQQVHPGKKLLETKSTRAYKKAKEACVKASNGELKGLKLKECIVNYQKEAK